MSKFYKDLTVDEVIDRLVAQDVRTILRAADEGDYQFLSDVLEGNGVVAYRNMKPDDLEAEYATREDDIQCLIEDDELPWEVR
jgi:hypothetical protein